MFSHSKSEQNTKTKSKVFDLCIVLDTVDNCASNPCQNGGVCNPTGSGYTCTCSAEYTGDNCECEL